MHRPRAAVQASGRLVRPAGDREQVGRGGEGIGVVLRNSAMTRTQKQAGDAAGDAPDPFPHEPSFGRRADVYAADRDHSKPGGGKNLPHAHRSEADFMREIPIPRRTCERALRVERQQPELAARLQCEAARIEKLEQFIRLQMLDEIAMAMAGRIAEELVSGDISTGASGDINQATHLARNMVCQWGMSDKVGMVQYGSDNDNVFLGRDFAAKKDYSEKTAQEIDEEVRRIITEAYNRSKQLIETNRDKLEMIANALLEYETLDGSQVEDIIRTGTFTPPPVNPKNIDPPSGAAAVTPLGDALKPKSPPLPDLGGAAPAPA